jgi:hypothetical protein
MTDLRDILQWNERRQALAISTLADEHLRICRPQ